METTNGTLRLRETFTDTLPATGAKLHLAIAGSKFVMGASVYQEVPEVRGLIETLQAGGFRLEEVSIESVKIDGEKGVITRTATATYEVLARCTDISRLPRVLVALGDLKKCSLRSIDWEYTEAPDQKTAWIDTCAERASQRALAIAEAMGVELEGILSIDEARTTNDATGTVTLDADRLSPRSRALTESLEGLTLAPSREKTVAFDFVFRISSTGVGSARG